MMPSRPPRRSPGSPLHGVLRTAVVAVALMAAVPPGGPRPVEGSSVVGAVHEGPADVAVQVPSDNTARIQESHLLCVHILCAAVEHAMARA